MNICHLNIANYIIRIESSDVDLIPGKRFENFLMNETSGSFDEAVTLRLKVRSGAAKIPPEAVRVFHAPYVEETGRERFCRDPEFWSVWKNGNDLFIKTVFPGSEGKKSALLKFSLEQSEWELNIEGDKRPVDPLGYPLDGLLLYYLTVIQGDIIIHASGINHNEKGYVFSGVSGKGKTTISRIWNNAGAGVIHDDRLIIRRIRDKYCMYNTPVYDNDEPRNSILDRIYIIEHGKRNRSAQVRGASAISLVMANCIQHNWDAEIISVLLGSVSGMCDKIPVYKLEFTPDGSVIRHISENE